MCYKTDDCTCEQIKTKCTFLIRMRIYLNTVRAMLSLHEYLPSRRIYVVIALYIFRLTLHM